MLWYVIQTKRHREQLAQASLARRGLQSYLPRIVQWPRPVVGGEVAPMFPGYLFVFLSLPKDFSSATWCPGVKTFVTFGETPVPMDPRVIDFLREREGADGLIRCGGGTGRVKITGGPFRGLTAVVEQRLPARERVRVLMDLLQRQTPVELPEKWVRQA